MSNTLPRLSVKQCVVVLGYLALWAFFAYSPLFSWALDPTMNVGDRFVVTLTIGMWLLALIGLFTIIRAHGLRTSRS